MLLFLLFLVLLLVLVWELWICEGAHLGRRFVVWLYDLAATRYDGIKGFDPDWERQFLGDPLMKILGSLPDARLLDVGSGTGRTFRAMPRGFLRHRSDADDIARTLGRHQRLPNLREAPPKLMLGLEPSKHMLDLGRRMLSGSPTWVRGWAVPLPVASESFDVVVCLEVLEFTPSPAATLAEIYRVLRPGGWALVSNRVGWQAPLILGRTFSRDRFPEKLSLPGFTEVDVFPWQVDYDMALARKPWT